MEKNSRGGKREGAGRKPIGERAKRATIAVRVNNKTKDSLLSEANRRGQTISKVVEEIIKEAGY